MNLEGQTLQATNAMGMGDMGFGQQPPVDEVPMNPGTPIASPMDQNLPQEAPEEDPETQAKADLDRLLEITNIAEHLDQEVLDKMGLEVFRGYQIDLESKSNWDKMIDSWVALATQLKEEKTYPWPKAANVKYPLLSTASLQFQARAYPTLIPADGKIVQMKVVGQDPQGQKVAKAERLAKHMNYQILADMQDWEEEMDRLLIQLPIVGCLFKKTYYDPIQKRNVSRLLGPKDLVVNYWASGLESAYRKTEIIQMTKNDLKVMQNADLYLDDVELPEPKPNPELPTKSDVHDARAPGEADATTPYVILEQHTFWDLDDDGYAEPYIITIELQSRKVLRVVARWDSDGIKTEEDGELLCIEPVEYYTKYDFIPNPDGGFYSVGFGHLLGPLNESANTIINQLIDAGTLANMQAGFLGKGLRVKLGETKFQPGEWKMVNATGDDIKKQIFPLPTKEPSEVLFKLLGMIVESTKELASVAEIFVGKMPGQNTPATTTMASIEQGMKVFTAIYKRVYRSLTKEYKKLFRLNSIHPETLERAQVILDEPITPQDYDPRSFDVLPTADPTAASETQKLLKAEGLMQVLQLGTLNVQEVTRRILEAQGQPNLEALMGNPTPQKDPKAEAMMMKTKIDQEKRTMDIKKSQMDAMMKERKAQMDLQFKQREQEMDIQMKTMEMKLKEMEAQMKARHASAKHSMDMVQTTQAHQNSMVETQQAHELKTKQMKEQADAKASAARVAGARGNGSSATSNKGKN